MDELIEDDDKAGKEAQAIAGRIMIEPAWRQRSNTLEFTGRPDTSVNLAKSKSAG